MRPEIEDPKSFALIQYGALVGLQWLLENFDDTRLPGVRRVSERLFGLAEQETARQETAQKAKSRACHQLSQTTAAARWMAARKFRAVLS